MRRYVNRKQLSCKHTCQRRPDIKCFAPWRRANKKKPDNANDADYDRFARELVYDGKAHAGGQWTNACANMKSHVH